MGGTTSTAAPAGAAWSVSTSDFAAAKAFAAASFGLHPSFTSRW
eukprot:CAMPEP_0115064460 /NCGR_PEP_ID=MMETSP0227-20121206/9695_1 /TAXON_ID=89957 /ORGANISM="Polarella glacialis, Strain CCMP 1383" /LENGTH=43 /DNA_ID= /DNA_START= /DNA_END= /DNA_ORIENTATION=